MDPELEQRLKDFDEKKDQEFKEKIAKLDKEWPLEKRNLAITEMKAKQKTEQEWEEIERLRYGFYGFTETEEKDTEKKKVDIP